MVKNIIEKYGKNSINEFWFFVDELNFDCSTSDADTVKVKLLKRLSPNTATKFKEICDDYAHNLYALASSKKETSYLYASYEAVARGREFYTTCTDNINTIAPLLEHARTLNHFGNVFPTDDDYFGSAPTYVVQEDFDYDEFDD